MQFLNVNSALSLLHGLALPKKCFCDIRFATSRGYRYVLILGAEQLDSCSSRLVHSLGMDRSRNPASISVGFMGEVHLRLLLVNILCEHYHDPPYWYAYYRVQLPLTCVFNACTSTKLEEYGG